MRRYVISISHINERAFAKIISTNFFDSDQHVTRLTHELKNLLLYYWIGQHVWLPAMRTSQRVDSTEQSTNQWTFIVHVTAVFTEMHTSPLSERLFAIDVAFDRQSRHLLRRGSHRTAAVVAARDAFERRNSSSKKSYCLTVCAHRRPLIGIYVTCVVAGRPSSPTPASHVFLSEPVEPAN